MHIANTFQIGKLSDQGVEMYNFCGVIKRNRTKILTCPSFASFINLNLFILWTATQQNNDNKT